MDNKLQEQSDESLRRRLRVNRLKKMILMSILLLILIPTLIAIVLAVYLHNANKQIEKLQNQIDMLMKVEQSSNIYDVSPVETSERDTSLSMQKQDNEPAYATEGDEDVSASVHKVYLTFDDGPSSQTDRILDILDEYGVKATFFVIGNNKEKYEAQYKRIVEEGHTLGMHSYSHKYAEIYASKEAFAQDLDTLQNYLYDVTGVWPRFYRFPGGSSNLESKVDMHDLIAYLEQQDITYFDWNVDSKDAVSGGSTKESIIANCLAKVDTQTETMILMHDSPDKRATVEALPEILEALLARDGIEIVPVDDDTVPVQHITNN